MKPAREPVADLDILDRRIAWQNERAPITCALLDRCYEFLTRLADEDLRGEVNGAILLLSGSVEKGLEADEADRREVEERLMRIAATE